MVMKGRQSKGLSHPGTKWSDEMALKLRFEYGSTGVSLSFLSKKYSIPKSTVYRIVNLTSRKYLLSESSLTKYDE